MRLGCRWRRPQRSPSPTPSAERVTCRASALPQLPGIVGRHRQHPSSLRPILREVDAAGRWFADVRCRKRTARTSPCSQQTQHKCVVYAQLSAPAQFLPDTLLPLDVNVSIPLYAHALHICHFPPSIVTINSRVVQPYIDLSSPSPHSPSQDPDLLRGWIHRVVRSCAVHSDGVA